MNNLIAKLFTALVLMGLLAGCVTLTAPSVTVKIPEANDALWTLSAKQVGGGNGGTVSLYINGVLIGSNSDFPSPANINGYYDEHTIQAVCPTLTNHYRATAKCDVYVDGTMTATLYLQ